MSAESVLAPKFDARDPELIADPYPVYARLRAAAALCRGGPGQWVVTRYDDVAALLRDPRLTKRMPAAYYRLAGAPPRLERFLERMNMGRRDAELASRIGAAFRAPRVAALRPRLETLAAELLDGLGERMSFDWAAEFALPFPLMVMCELLGVPAGDRDALWPQAAALLASFSDAALLTERNLEPAERSLRWMEEYLGGLLASRRTDPGDDVLSRLLAPGQEGRRFTEEEIVESAIRLFYAGFETSKALLCNGLLALLESPHELARLRAQPGAMAGAVDELLRYDAPIQISLRVALEPIDVGGRRIREGRVVLLLLGSANRDERRFPDPDRLDIGRRPNPHLAFGGGLHYCLGAALARQEAAVGLGALLDRYEGIELAGEPTRSPLINLRGVQSLPVGVTAARARVSWSA